MIFTAVQTLRSQTASQEFKAYGANNLAPAVVSASRIIAIPSENTGLTRRMRLEKYLPEYVERVSGKVAADKPLPAFTGGSATSAHHAFSERLVSILDAVSVIKNPTENKNNALEQAGYRKVTTGRLHILSGTFC